MVGFFDLLHVGRALTGRALLASLPEPPLPSRPRGDYPRASLRGQPLGALQKNRRSPEAQADALRQPVAGRCRPNLTRCPGQSQSNSPPGPFLPALAGPGTSDAGRRPGDARPKVSFRRSLKQADRPGGRLGYRPQAGEIVVGQMGQDPVDDWPVFDTRDYLDQAGATRAGLHINTGDALGPLRTPHRRLLFSWRAALLSRRSGGPGISASAGQRDSVAVQAVGCKYAVDFNRGKSREILECAEFPK